MFGNLKHQGIFKSKTMQDFARLILLAPQWTEGMFRNEARSYGQAIAGAARMARGNGPQWGNAARAMAIGTLGIFLANQLINFASRGKPTWENEEDGHKLDGFIPGGKRGFWLNPMEISGEYLHAAMKYSARHESGIDISTHIAENKFSGLARGGKELATGRDYAGKPFLSTTDRVRAAATDILPMPIFMGAALEKDPRQTFGYRANRQPGSVEKQALGMVGAKVIAAESPRTQMFALAKPFRADRSGKDLAGEYTQLRQALDNDDMDAAREEIRLLFKNGKPREAILHSVGIKTGGKTSGEISPESFTRSKHGEEEMLKSLTPYQRTIYAQAQKDHTDNAKKLQRIIKTVAAPAVVQKRNADSRVPMLKNF